MDGDRAGCPVTADWKRSGLSGGAGVNEHGKLNVCITQYPSGPLAYSAFFQGPQRGGQAADPQGVGSVCPVAQRAFADAGAFDE